MLRVLTQHSGPLSNPINPEMLNGMFYKFCFKAYFTRFFIPVALSAFSASCCLSLGCDARITPSLNTTICSKMPAKPTRHNL